VGQTRDEITQHLAERQGERLPGPRCPAPLAHNLGK
jgi:hypothetical protein